MVYGFARWSHPTTPTRATRGVAVIFSLCESDIARGAVIFALCASDMPQAALELRCRFILQIEVYRWLGAVPRPPPLPPTTACGCLPLASPRGEERVFFCGCYSLLRCRFATPRGEKRKVEDG